MIPDRMKLAARLEGWIAQEVGAGRLGWHIKKSGDVKLIKGTTLPELAPDAEDGVEMALDMPGLSTPLRKGEALSYRAWSHIADRLGTTGPLPALAEVLATRRAYWAACDAAHDRRRAAHRASAQVAHPKTPETPTNAPAGLYGAPAVEPSMEAPETAAAASAPQALPEEPVKEPWVEPEHLKATGRMAAGRVVVWMESRTYQLGWLALHAELDAPRAAVGEPWERARWAPDVARQDFNPKRYEREMARLTPPAWMDQAPPWGEEVRDDEGDEAGDEGRGAAGRGATGDRRGGAGVDR